MNAKISVFVICVEAIIFVTVYDCIYNINTSCFSDVTDIIFENHLLDERHFKISFDKIHNELKGS